MTGRPVATISSNNVVLAGVPPLPAGRGDIAFSYLATHQ